jgi:hypothetical protein
VTSGISRFETWRGAVGERRTRKNARPVIVQQMQLGLRAPDFAGVRGQHALARLPAAERHAWQTLWADVADTLARAHGTTAREK